MTGTLRASTVWDWMPFMAGLNGEEGPHAHENPAHGVERELKGKEGLGKIEPGHVNELPNIQIHLDPHRRLP